MIFKVFVEIGYKVEVDDFDVIVDGYEVDDVKCKDGELEVNLDKELKINEKEKDKY